MNQLEILNRVEEHLLRQGRKAEVGSDCRYRTNNGLKCALGCLIADEFYTPELEEDSIESPVICQALINSGVDFVPGYRDSDWRLLIKLQSIHDNCPAEHWPRRFKELRKELNLWTD